MQWHMPRERSWVLDLNVWGPLAYTDPSTKIEIIQTSDCIVIVETCSYAPIWHIDKHEISRCFSIAIKFTYFTAEGVLHQ